MYTKTIFTCSIKSEGYRKSLSVSVYQLANLPTLGLMVLIMHIKEALKTLILPYSDNIIEIIFIPIHVFQLPAMRSDD